MDGDHGQGKSLCELPPEVIEEIVMRMGRSDIQSLAETCTYFRDSVYANIMWIKRCKREFGIKIEPSVAEKAGKGSVFAFYRLILEHYGPFLGPLRHTNCRMRTSGIDLDPELEYGAMFQLVHDGQLGLVCYEWVPPASDMGVEQPMSLLRYSSVTIEKELEVNQSRSVHPNFRVKMSDQPLVIMTVMNTSQVSGGVVHIQAPDHDSLLNHVDEQNLSKTDQQNILWWRIRKEREVDSDPLLVCNSICFADTLYY